MYRAIVLIYSIAACSYIRCGTSGSYIVALHCHVALSCIRRDTHACVTFFDAGGALYSRQEQGGKEGYGEKAAWGEEGDEVAILFDV